MFGARKKKNKSAEVICVCVSFNRSQSTTNENAHRSHVIVYTNTVQYSDEKNIP